MTFFFLVILFAQGQTVVGKWKTDDDDEIGNVKSIVEIYEKSGKIYGNVVDILEEQNKKRFCSNCSGDDKNKPIRGMTIIKRTFKKGF